MMSPFPKRTALLVLLTLGVIFGGNHVAARLAFDHGTGLITAVVARSGVTALALLGVLMWQGTGLRPPPGSGCWLAVLGLLISVQSLLLYSAVARIPVALALLAFNTFPAIYALLSWALGGKPPARRAVGVMALILFGLSLALDAPAALGAGARTGPALAGGVMFAVGAAITFAVAVWLTEHRLYQVAGPLRSFTTMLIVSIVVLLGGIAGVMPGAMHWPADTTGWVGLVLLTALYGTAFSTLFVLMPRLDMARNAPAQNIEPIAALVLSWLILGQKLSVVQLAGALLVVTGIVLLARRKST
jgi:drug/metabolite transporter (DMT)-like permease